MILVHKFGPEFGIPDASPFVVKVETYLRMTEQKYETFASDVRKAPREQLPFVEIDGNRIADSTEIIDHLEASRAHKLDSHLDKKQRAIATAFKSMLEEHLYFGLLYMRWSTDDGWSVWEPSLRSVLGKAGVPGLMTGLVAGRIRKQVSGRSRTQGVGRKPRAGVVAMCTRLLDAFADHLGDAPYFCGDAPTTYDATAYAFAQAALLPAFDNEVRKHAATKENLVAYAERLNAKYWGTE